MDIGHQLEVYSTKIKEVRVVWNFAIFVWLKIEIKGKRKTYLFFYIDVLKCLNYRHQIFKQDLKTMPDFKSFMNLYEWSLIRLGWEMRNYLKLIL